MERKRPEKSTDRLRWYCPNTERHSSPHVIREVGFHCTDLGTQLKPLINVRPFYFSNPRTEL